MTRSQLAPFTEGERPARAEGPVANKDVVQLAAAHRPDHGGHSRKPSTVKRDLKAVMERAGVPAVSTHGQRHMAATIMPRAGVSPALVALKLGHADIGTTVDRYGSSFGGRL